MDPFTSHGLEPQTPRSLDRDGISNEKENRDIHKSLGHKLNIKDYSVILAAFIGTLLVMVSVISLNSRNDLRSRAAVDKVDFYLYPKTATLGAGEKAVLSPKMTSSSKMGIIKVIATIAFNPKEVRIDKLILPATNGQNIIYESSPITQANKIGKLKIQLRPKIAGYKMQGVVNLPQLQFTKLEGNQISGVNIVSMESKVLFENGLEAGVTVDKPTLITPK